MPFIASPPLRTFPRPIAPTASSWPSCTDTWTCSRRSSRASFTDLRRWQRYAKKREAIKLYSHARTYLKPSCPGLHPVRQGVPHLTLPAGLLQQDRLAAGQRPARPPRFLRGPPRPCLPGGDADGQCGDGTGFGQDSRVAAQEETEGKSQGAGREKALQADKAVFRSVHGYQEVFWALENSSK